MNPTPVAHVKAVADAGEVMPQKSTFFYPKLASGLVINPDRAVGGSLSDDPLYAATDPARRLDLVAAARGLSLLDRSAAARRLRPATPVGRVIDFCAGCGVVGLGALARSGARG